MRARGRGGARQHRTRSRCSAGILSRARSRRRGDRHLRARPGASIPTSQEAYLYLGALYGKRGEIDRAVATLKRLVARNPNSILGYYYLGRVYAAARQLDKAEHYYLEALKLNPQSELVLTDLALAYELAGRGPKAIELYQRILALNPQSVVVRRGSAASTSGRSSSTRRSSQFRELEKVDADPREARTKIGLIYFEKGELERAATEFNLVLGAEPDERARALLPRRRCTRSSDETAARARRSSPASRRTPSTTSTRACGAPTCCRRTTPAEAIRETRGGARR